MNLIDIATISFSDLASGGAGVVVIRAAEGQLALCLSLAEESDVEVVLDPGNLDKLLAALQRAAHVVKGQTQ